MPWQQGESGNPGGLARQQRKLNRKVMNVLREDFQEHGARAVVRMREVDPSGYVRCLVSLLPKDVNLEINSSSEFTEVMRTLSQQLRESAEVRVLDETLTAATPDASEPALLPPRKAHPAARIIDGEFTDA